MTQASGARRPDRILERVEHHPALLVLRHILESAEARSYAGAYLDVDDFPTQGSRRLFRLLTACLPPELASTDDPMPLRALAKAHDPELLWIVDNALTVGDSCVAAWPIADVVALMLPASTEAVDPAEVAA